MKNVKPENIDVKSNKRSSLIFNCEQFTTWVYLFKEHNFIIKEITSSEVNLDDRKYKVSVPDNSWEIDVSEIKIMSHRGSYDGVIKFKRNNEIKFTLIGNGFF